MTITAGKNYDGLFLSPSPSNELTRNELETVLLSEVSHRCLKLKSISSKALGSLTLSVQALVKVEALEGSEVKIFNVTGEQLELIAQSQSTTITASGTSARLRAQANDGASIELSDFKSKNVSSGASRGGRILS